MSDSEKPLDPTPQRIARAKREGNVARSSELAANASFAAAALSAAAVASPLGACARDAIAAAAHGASPTLASAGIVGFALVPPAAAAVAGVLAGALQAGGLRFVSPAPKFERCDPVRGVKRLCSRETLAHAARAACAFAVAAASMLPWLFPGAWPAVQGAPWSAVASSAWRSCESFACVACAVGTLFAGAEYVSARRAWLRTLRMSFDERRREAKDQEGDPHARGRRRALHRSLSRGAIARVKEAAFVVVNPTHVAIALEYEPPRVPVPSLLVRAADAAALRVREAAMRYGVPLIENAPLARALYRDARAGDAIPHAHYIAVAEIVASLTRAGVRR